MLPFLFFSKTKRIYLFKKKLQSKSISENKLLDNIGEKIPYSFIFLTIQNEHKVAEKYKKVNW